MIRTSDLTARLWALQTIGWGADGWTRLAWTPEHAAAEQWFRREARDARLEVQRDPAGSLWAVPRAPEPWWAVGSHLDTVRQGGEYDGALGVAAGFEIARLCRRPVAVIAFADEEGARFNTPTFGSRALASHLDVDEALGRRDRRGIRLADALADFGVDPAGVAGAPAWLDRLAGFVELHIDQSLDVATLGVPAAVVSGLAARRRVRVDVTGRADHAGTTPMEQRSDALAAAARIIAAATEPGGGGLRATATRLEVAPNALTTIPSAVTVWLDLRAPEPALLDAALARLRAVAEATWTVESDSPPVGFDAGVRRALAAACERLTHAAPEVTCFAGHDAGVLAERIPAGMLLVRNEHGISHAPEEDIALSDAACGAEAILRTLESL